MNKHFNAFLLLFLMVSECASSLSANDTTNIDYKMRVELPNVQINASRYDFGAKSAQMSAIEIPIAQIRTMPVIFGEIDVMKTLQKLPGVHTTGEGKTGFVVRGGEHDQNLITIDGATLYNADHLNGFVSAINADVLGDLAFYKGAFPAHYGSRLSSVVDISIAEGNMQEYHGALTLGILSSKLHVNGPIIKGRTSFNVAARMSYFDVIAQPILNKVYDNKDGLSGYNEMNYYDATAKITHLFNDNDKLTATVYWGHDKNNTSPSESSLKKRDSKKQFESNRNYSSDSNWGNIMASIDWEHKIHNQFSLKVNANYSNYRYRTAQKSDINDRTSSLSESENKWITQKIYKENSNMQYNSDIDDVGISFDFYFDKIRSHNLQWGIKGSYQNFTPTVVSSMYTYKFVKADNPANKDSESENRSTTTIGSEHNVVNIGLYAEDTWTLGKHWKLGLGLRYSMTSVSNKIYHSIEPRASLRYLINNNIAIKASYSRMSQHVHQLSSGNIVMPSDIWVPATEKIPQTTSNMWALAYNHTLPWGLELSVEGYYKTMDNLIDYKEGANYTDMRSNWQNLVAIGNGRSYGVELLLQRKFGNTTGWISYTWSKSLRQYDNPMNEINRGKEFYAGNDRRNTFNIVVTHKFNEHWQISANWSYSTGRRGHLPASAFYGGTLHELNPFGKDYFSSDSYMPPTISTGTPGESTHLKPGLIYVSYSERNGIVLPSVHSLDIGATYSIKTGKITNDINITITNLYNRMNISNVYLGYHNNRMVLKGVCPFPIMPSINYTLKF